VVKALEAAGAKVELFEGDVLAQGETLEKFDFVFHLAAITNLKIAAKILSEFSRRMFSAHCDFWRDANM